MKRLIFVIAAFTLACSSTFASDIDAGYHTVTHNLYIKGNAGVSNIGEEALIMLVDKNITKSNIPENQDNIYYIDTCTVDENGMFSGKVKIDDTTAQNSTVYVKCNDYIQQITEFSNTDVSDTIDVSLRTENALNFSNDTLAAVKLHINNMFGDTSVCRLSIAFYDDNNRFIKAMSDNTKQCNFNTTDDTLSVSDIPENAVKAKIFLWQDMKSMTNAEVITKEKESVNLYLIGDSTCFTYNESNSNGGIQQGWGYYINEYFDNVNVHNLALCGASAKSYKEQTYNPYYWDYVLSIIKPEDYVFICFSINDNSAYEDDVTETYKSYMQGFINDLKAKGTKLVILTEQPTEVDPFNELLNISRGVKEIAAKNDILCLDLNKMSTKHYEKMGYSQTKDAYYLTNKAAERLNAVLSSEDTVHLNTDGARMISEMIVQLLIDSDCDLRSYVNDKPRTKLNDTPQTYNLQ